MNAVIYNKLCSHLHKIDPFLFFCIFPILGLALRAFSLHILRSCASSIFTCFSFMYFLITSFHLGFGLPIFQCPPTSIFHVLIRISSQSYFSNFTCPCSYFFIPDIFNPLRVDHVSSRCTKVSWNYVCIFVS